MKKKKANVILIVSDQWSRRMADREGVKTSAIDELRKEGISFEESYTTFPLCCPARSSMFTGLMPHNTNIIDNQEVLEENLGYIPKRDDVTTMGEVFKEAGYETAYFGKEDAGGYGWEGIDEYGSLKYSAGGYLAEGSVYDSIFAKDAIEYIKRDHKNPFYMTVSFINPHDICKTLGGSVAGKNISDAILFCQNENENYLRGEKRADLPENSENEFVKGMILDKDYMYSEMENYSENDWKKYISTYNLLIEKTDWHISIILDTIKSKGIEEDTIVVFTTDHGEMMGSHKLIAKTVFYEESVKTPMIIKYPNQIDKNQIDNKTIMNTADLMPTLLDLCEIKIPENLDGKSFKQRCFGKGDGEFEKTFSENQFGRMLRFGKYKYVRSEVYGEKYEILFDLENDPNETKNCFGEKKYEERSLYAREELELWMKKENISFKF